MEAMKGRRSTRKSTAVRRAFVAICAVAACSSLLGFSARADFARQDGPVGLGVGNGTGHAYGFGWDGGATAGYRTSVDTSGYDEQSIVFAARTMDGGAAQAFDPSVEHDDEFSGAIAIPFTFKFYGTDYTSLRVSSNGYVSFTGDTPLPPAPYAELMPDAAAPNGFIAVAQGDLDLNTGAGSIVRYETFGTAPQRVFVVDFFHAAQCCEPIARVTSQIQLYEGTDVIEIHSAQMTLTDPTFVSTQGIENASGTLAVFPPGRNRTNSLALTNDAVRFTPSDAASAFGTGYGLMLPRSSNLALGAYNAGTGQWEISSSQASNLIAAGLLVPNGSNPADTDRGTFSGQVLIDTGTGTVQIPAGAALTGASVHLDFTTFSASSTIDASGLPAGDLLRGGLQAGLAAAGVTSTASIAIRINVSSSLNGQTLKVYRKPPAGSWTFLTTCFVTSGVCPFSTTSLSEFAATTPPAVTVSAPNGGESFTGNASQNVTWTSVGLIDHFRLSLSTDSGSTFPTSVSSSATSPFSWTVPNVTTAHARIKVEALDAGNSVLASDASDADFTINPATSGGSGSTAPPTISLFQPNGGQVLFPGTVYPIMWTLGGNGIVAVRISLSKDGGSTFSSTITSDGQQGFFSWRVPDEPLPEAKVRVEGLLVGGAVGAADESDGTFFIPARSVPALAAKDETAVIGAPEVSRDEANLKLPRATPVDAIVKQAGDTTLYYVGFDAKRHPFVNETAFLSWYRDFSGVKTIDAETLASIPLGSPVLPRPGSFMVKIVSDPKTYYVSPGYRLHWIEDEAAARALFGDGWNRRVVDIDPAFFQAYETSDLINLSGLGAGWPDGALVRSVQGRIWYVTGGKRREVLSAEAFDANGFQERFASGAGLEGWASLPVGAPIEGAEDGIFSLPHHRM